VLRSLEAANAVNINTYILSALCALAKRFAVSQFAKTQTKVITK